MLTIILSTQVQALDCRNAVVEAQKTLGNNLAEDSFSNASFEDFNLTVEQFNALSSAKQEKIYIQIKPLETMVKDSIVSLNQKINQIIGTFYELFLAAELQEWREKREQLKSCE